MTTEVPILKCMNLNKTFKKDLLKKNVTTLNNLSCEFEDKKLTVLLGHNGAGKTTLIKSILGLIKPDSGEIYFKGKKITQSDRAQIGFMPENNWIPSLLTPYETLQFHAKLFPQIIDTKNKVHHLLAKVGLEKHMHKQNKNLSKGMGRRLAWAMASIHEPQLLILDEPYSGLDPVGRQELLDWLSEQYKKNVSILLCTHELHYLPKETDKLVIFNQGKLAYSDTANPLPSHDELFNLLIPRGK